MVTKSLAALEEQLEQAHRDISALQELKGRALEAPEQFVGVIENRGECERMFPKMQTVAAVPPIPLDTYRGRLVRRGAGKYGQNLDELQKSRPTEGGKTDSPLLSPCVPIGRTPPSHTPEAPLRDTIRRRFNEIVGAPVRTASAPALFSTIEPIPASSMNDAVPNRDDLFSPQPRKAQSIHFTMPFLPSDPNSRPSTPAIVTPEQPKKRKRMASANADSPHHNLPWTEEEKQRLIELLEVYPEEEVNARRYAKIAAAIGTRTPGQVANRVNKLQLKTRRRTEGKIDPGEDLDEVLDIELRNSKEYQEYMTIRKQIEALESDSGISVHVGFKCDDCGMEPIVGTRWRCTKCHEPNAIDLCQECYECGEFNTAQHRPSHRFFRHNS